MASKIFGGGGRAIIHDTLHKMEEITKAQKKAWEDMLKAPNPTTQATGPGGVVPNVVRSGLRLWDKDQFDRDVGEDDELYLESLDIATDTVYIETRPLKSIYKMTSQDVCDRGMGPLLPHRYFTLRECRNNLGFSGRLVCNVPPQFVVQLNDVPSAPDTIQANITHVLHQGSPMCGFSTARPVDWPKGHDWMSLQAVLETPEGHSSGVTCQDCAVLAADEWRKHRG